MSQTEGPKVHAQIDNECNSRTARLHQHPQERSEKEHRRAASKRRYADQLYRSRERLDGFTSSGAQVKCFELLRCHHDQRQCLYRVRSHSRLCEATFLGCI